MKRKSLIKQVIDKNINAVLVKNKYKVLVGLVRRMYPKTYEKIEPHLWEEIIYEVVNGDRDWRLLTKGFDKKNKDKLEKQWIENNL